MRQFSSSLLCVTCLALVLAGCRCKAPPVLEEQDTPASRLAATRDYVSRVPVDGVIEEAISQLVAKREASQQEDLKRLLKREIRARVIEEAAVQALARHFTVAEIRALTAFNSSPEGRSIQRKLGGYMNDVLPPLQEEIDRVLSLTNAALAQLQWDTRLIEGRASVEDEKMIVEFPFMNQGTRTVNILSVDSSCACTSGSADRTNYPPRYGGTVRVEFDFGPRIGPQSKYVTVLTDDPAEPSVRLQVDVEIPEVVRISPPFSLWRVGEEAATRTNRVTLLQPGTKVEGIECSNTLFRAEWRGAPAGDGEVCVTPGTSALRDAGQLDLLVRVSPTVVRRFPVPLAVSSKK